MERAHGTARRATLSETAEILVGIAAALALAWLLVRRRRARRAVDGASHELLNAMTVIRGHMELLGRRGPASAADVDSVRDIVMDELARMEGQVDDLGRR